MFEKIEKCPLCNGANLRNYLICQDYTVSNERFTIVRCSDCSFLFTNPRPDKEILPKYYRSNSYISHSDKTQNITDVLYKTARFFTLRKKLNLVNRLSNEKSILDFGCGTGYFLNTCKKNGWSVYGYEPEKLAATHASKLTGEGIISDFNQLYKINPVNVITLWHVLEHVPDLNDTVVLLKKKLQQSGTLVIAVPNHKSYDAQHYGKYWAAYDVPRHLYHFSQDSMKKLLKIHGFKLIEILPMKLDSYYVSLLSEKYKTGRSNYFKSFLTGYKSNVYAKKSTDYSSLIYIAGK